MAFFYTLIGTKRSLLSAISLNRSIRTVTGNVSGLVTLVTQLLALGSYSLTI